MLARAAALLSVAIAVAAPAATPAEARVDYRIPLDNPFVTIPGARGEVYAYGLRNPYRWSFDRRTGDMYIGDVGGDQREEITYLARRSIRGANLGWNCFEGTFVQRACRLPNYFPPSHQFRSSPDVVIGGHVVRDPALPSLRGRYLYGRYDSGIYVLPRRASGRAVRTAARVDGLTSLTEDGVGHLYATSYDGPVYRLIESAGSLALASLGTFTRPVAVAAPPGDAERLFIVEKQGVVKLRAGGQVTDFLDISALVGDRGYEEGLLAFAVAPGYARTGRVFAYYTDNEGDLQLDEYVRSAAGPERAEASSRRPLLTIRHDRSDSHNGGQLLFGPDGYLYLSTGDGDLMGDPERDAQRRDSLLGKMLRLDVDGSGLGMADTVAPALRARVERRRTAPRSGGAVVRVSCSESCVVAAGGRLRIAGREYRLRRVATRARAGRRARLEAAPTARGRRALRGRGRATLRIRLRARDTSENRSPVVACQMPVSGPARAAGARGSRARPGCRSARVPAGRRR